MNSPRLLYTRIYFAVIILIGLLVFRDYGVTWDEPVDRMNGMVNFKYIMTKIAPGWAEQQIAFSSTPDFATYLENDHGPIFHLPLAVFDQQWGGYNPRPYYLVRHLSIFLVVVLGAWATYRLAWLRFGNWKWGIVASLLLFLSPRFFAESFNNGKDIVFMALFALGIFSLVQLLQRPTWSKALLHGLITGLATDVRIMGCLLLFITFGMLVVEFAFAPMVRQERWNLLRKSLLYYGAACVFTVVGWPYLWEAPVTNFLLAFENMRQFRWNGEVIYLGEVMRAMQLPWHYAPVWIIVTTPVAYTCAFLLGVIVSTGYLLNGWSARLRTFEGRLDLLFLGWAIGPVLMIILFDSIIYDGWRHLYFIYPAFLLVAVRGASWLWHARLTSARAKRVVVALAVLAGAEGVFTLGRMVEAHPNQQVYFSFLLPSQVEQLFERDYWGASYRQGLEWILANDPAPSIPVYSTEPDLLENGLSILKPEDRARLRVASEESERYYLTNYRFHPQPYPVEQVGWEVHAVRSNGVKILSVFTQK